ncbi:hypothetical protein BHE74_00018543 [Ensete ventricosum]|nr:hypothetical protein BHE74_00018543 [Ensete ventricosum]
MHFLERRTYYLTWLKGIQNMDAQHQLLTSKGEDPIQDCRMELLWTRLYPQAIFIVRQRTGQATSSRVTADARQGGLSARRFTSRGTTDARRQAITYSASAVSRLAACRRAPSNHRVARLAPRCRVTTLPRHVRR